MWAGRLEGPRSESFQILVTHRSLSFPPRQVDIGQIEGAFVQGLGYYLTEEVEFDPEGRLLTNGTWHYKPPGVNDIPLHFDVSLLPPLSAAVETGTREQRRSRTKVEKVGQGEEKKEKEGLILSSKATGEPPFMLASSAYFGVVAAIREGKREWGQGGECTSGEMLAKEVPLAISATIKKRIEAIDVPVEAFVL